MPTSDRSEHSRDDLWGRINKQSESIAEIKAGQAATDARLGSLESLVEQGFRSIANEIHGLAEKVHQPKEQLNPIALFVGLVAVLTMFGSFALLIAQPIEADTAANHREIKDHEERQFNHQGRIAALEAQVGVLLGERD